MGACGTLHMRTRPCGEASPYKGSRVSSHRAPHRGQATEFSVRDTGPGFDPAFLARRTSRSRRHQPTDVTTFELGARARHLLQAGPRDGLGSYGWRAGRAGEAGSFSRSDCPRRAWADERRRNRDLLHRRATGASAALAGARPRHNVRVTGTLGPTRAQYACGRRRAGPRVPPSARDCGADQLHLPRAGPVLTTRVGWTVACLRTRAATPVATSIRAVNRSR